ncbi:TetR/AcrR family transcriptional regulator [Sulfuriflexus mobilis]|uniref:TetR/AcrR family transcriptional regulator n=1 Tax=Sulfuriflexus mobilis TaxID=1811807 RepID=UPI000F82E0DF|nr:TetR/AcrR family transcriptional regulator [Sulfuriflexus mobilis]
MSAGRQRTFNKEDALTKAMEVFWRNGYSGTSLSDLTEAMGINKPSLYAAFGNKEQLYVSALNEYVLKFGVPHFDKLLAPNLSLKQRVSDYLESIAEMVADSTLPGGCFLTSSTCEAGSDCLPSDALRTVSKINETSTNAFVNFFKDEQEKGNLPLTSSSGVLADFLLTMQFGLAVMARNGIKQDRLEQVINHAVSNF